MPILQTGGGYRWGGRGKVYKGPGAKAKAAKQARAAYASGYKGDEKPSRMSVTRRTKSRVIK